jgi:GT2 family glycosyltransferase
MKISVVLATFNRKNLLDNTISAYLSQDYGDKEIIVVDNASSDGTREMVLSKYPVEKYPELKYIYLPENINIKAVNIAIAISTGEIIWRSDDDAYLRDKDAFKKVAKIMKENPEIGIISVGLINKDVVNNSETFINWYPNKIDYINVPEFGYKAHTFTGNGGAIRKEVINKIGFFWEFGYEEMELSTRAIIAGYKIRYYPDIVVLHFGLEYNKGMNFWRWNKLTQQLIRYQAKYFPLRVAIVRSSIIMFYQLLFALKSKLSLFKMLQGIVNMTKTIYYTSVYENDIVETKLFNEITLGESLIKSYNQRIIGLIKRWYSNEYK